MAFDEVSEAATQQARIEIFLNHFPEVCPRIPFQKAPLRADLRHGLNNSCADFFCTKSESVFLGAVVGR